MSKTAAELVAEAGERADVVTVGELAAEIADGAILVDLREPHELVLCGAIPGSINVPRGTLEFRVDITSAYHQEPFHHSRRVIVHSASGNRSALAVATLQNMGYRSVAHLEGGFDAWRSSGNPIESIRNGNRSGRSS